MRVASQNFPPLNLAQFADPRDKWLEHCRVEGDRLKQLGTTHIEYVRVPGDAALLPLLVPLRLRDDRYIARVLRRMRTVAKCDVPTSEAFALDDEVVRDQVVFLEHSTCLHPRGAVALQQVEGLHMIGASFCAPRDWKSFNRDEAVYRALRDMRVVPSEQDGVGPLLACIRSLPRGCRALANKLIHQVRAAK